MAWKTRRSALVTAMAGVCIILAVTSGASAHRLGESYVFISTSETELTGRFELTLDDLGKVLPLDSNQDGEISVGEYEAMAAEAATQMQPTLQIWANGQSYEIVMTTTDVRVLPQTGTYALLSFEVPQLTDVPDALDIEYRFLFDDVDPDHRGMLVIENNTRTNTTDNERIVSAIFDPHHGRQEVSLLRTPWWKVLADFVKHGVWHIWIGLDHILFILALLLPSVLKWDPEASPKASWQPVDTFRDAMWNVLKVITLFTVAHSITLSLASLNLVQLPSSIVESIIALSIAVTAANNFRPLLSHRVWFVVVAFGLFHGFGFASVLAPLGLMTSNLVLALFGFNVGVELGQVAIIAVVFPILYALRKQSFYVPLILKLGSLALIGMSIYWFCERFADVIARAKELGYF